MTDRTGSPYVLISCDSHAGADLMGYRPYLSHEFYAEFDAWAAAFQEEAWGKFENEMVDADDPNVQMGVSSFGSPYNWDSAKRIEHMNADGIAAEVIFPNTIPPFYPRGVISAPGPLNAEEYRLRWAGAQAHNRWLLDFCAEAPGRRGGLAQVFLDDVDDAVAEVRWAHASGLAGILVPSDHTLKLVNLYERWLDPFWAECCRLGLPVVRHQPFVGPPETPESGSATTAIGAYESGPFFKRGMSHLILGGVFERFPDLKVIFTETGSSWVPDELAALDSSCQAAQVKGTVHYPLMHRAVESLSMTPTDYFGRNVWLGVSLMQRHDVRNRHQLGVDRIVWGSDYPHHEGSWPWTRLALRWNFWDVPEDEVRTMTSENAAGIYGFDLDLLQRLTDEIGPKPSDIARPVTLEELPSFRMSRTIAEAIESLQPSEA